jgi:ribokinase
MQARPIVVVGSVNIDHVIGCTTLPRPGETVEGRWFLETNGGKGANQALAAVRLGARATLVARVGANGHRIVEELKSEGVDTSLVSVDNDEPTGLASILVDAEGNKTIAIYAGANAHLSPFEVERADKAIASASAVLSQLEIPVDTVRAAFERARRRNVLTVLDPAPARRLDESLLALVDVMRPNALEAEALTGIAVSDRASARSAAQWLIARGVRTAAVSAGSAGNLIVTAGGDEWWFPHIDVRSVDATGAGDAFAAALAVALVEGQGYEQAGAFASAAAALATTAIGAQTALPTREAVLELLPAV